MQHATKAVQDGPQISSDIATLSATLSEHCEGLSSSEMLHKLMLEVFPGRIAVVSSFGAESAVLLDLVARIDRATPILFLDTGKHFPETISYRDTLINRLGLTNVQTIAPQASDLSTIDPTGELWKSNTDACCEIRKVRPLDVALAGYDAWISGRKRFHGASRSSLPLVEAEDTKVKINPMADWDGEKIEEYYTNFGLPRHPLFHEGYPSIGCAVCTSKPAPGADVRSGRWAGSGKTECGIHKARWSSLNASSL